MQSLFPQRWTWSMHEPAHAVQALFSTLIETAELTNEPVGPVAPASDQSQNTGLEEIQPPAHHCPTAVAPTAADAAQATGQAQAAPAQ